MDCHNWVIVKSSTSGVCGCTWFIFTGCVDWRLNSSFPAVVVLVRFSTENSLDMTCTYTHTHTHSGIISGRFNAEMSWNYTRRHTHLHTQKRVGREPVDMVSQLLSWLWLYQPQFCRLFCPFPVISCRV